ncbi:MAG: DUF721 domain-containing protein [Vulcanimicrobiaceae bacterium]
MSLRPIRESISRWKPSKGRRLDPLHVLQDAWGTVVGAEVAANSHPVQIAGDTLVVATRSSAWSQQLAYLAERILEAANGQAPDAALRHLRLRLGRVPARNRPPATLPGSAGSLQRVGDVAPQPSASLEQAFERFRADVLASQRAKRTAGWNLCLGCGVPVATGRSRCEGCAGADRQGREARIAQALFEAPWLGYPQLAEQIEGVEREEVEAVRRRLLMRWWDILCTVRRTSQLSRGGRERMIAGAYVVLKSGLPPDRIGSATVRTMLGDELYRLLYETPTTNGTNVE